MENAETTFFSQIIEYVSVAAFTEEDDALFGIKIAIFLLPLEEDSAQMTSIYIYILSSINS